MFGKRSSDQPVDAGDDGRYGAELLSANWNPVVALLARSSAATREHANRPPEDNEVDVEGFLTRVYTLGA